MGEQTSDDVEETIDRLEDVADDSENAESGTDTGERAVDADSESDVDSESDAETGENSVEESIDQLADAAEPSEASDSNGEATDEEPNADGDEPGSNGESDPVERAVTASRAVLEALAGDGTITDATGALSDLLDVAEETRELLETIDFSALPEATDLSELPQAIETEDVPEAIAEGEAGEAVRFRKLLQVVELGELWNEMDMRAVWQNKAELEDAIDDLSAEDEEGVFETMRETADAFGDDTGGVFDDTGGVFDETSGENTERDQSAESDAPEGIDVPTEVLQQRLQSKLSDAIEEFRQSVLDTRAELLEMREENADRLEGIEQPTSRNPTAVSTLASTGERTDMVTTSKHSTVPAETRYSTAPNHRRIYGDRFERSDEGRSETDG